MKFILSLAEAASAVRSRYDLDENVEIIISRPRSRSVVKKPVEPVQPSTIDPFVFLNAVSGMPDIAASGKIPAIRMVRTLLPGTDLATAKWIVENFANYTVFVNTNKRFPKLVGSYSNFTMA